MGFRYFVWLSNIMDLVQMTDGSYVGEGYDMVFTSF